MTVDEIDFRGDVVDCHFVEAEVPVFLITIRHVDVVSAVSVSTCISQPNIEAEISENESESFFRATKDPIS
jgi:hypothetical protein